MEFLRNARRLMSMKYFNPDGSANIEFYLDIRGLTYWFLHEIDKGFAGLVLPTIDINRRNHDIPSIFD